MSESGWDVVYGPHGVSVEPHFCREMGCFGTDPNHGASWEEAKAVVIEHLEQQIEHWKRKKEEDY